MPAESTDAQLLEAFARRRDQAAFAQVVERYAALVYSAALRQVEPTLAEDVSQAVFFILAKKAAQVEGRTLAGWLVNTARFAALASGRMEARLKRREEKAALMQPESVDPPHEGSRDWDQIAPLLDEALARLDENDRNAITMRYLQGKSVREVAAAMSLSEAAAGKRATRAIQTLRDYFARRGLNFSTESLGCALTAHAIVGVPASLAVKLTAAGVGGGTLSAGAGTIAKGAIPLMLTAKTQVAAVVIGLIVLGGGAAIVATQFNSRMAISPTTAPADLAMDQFPAETTPATQPITGDGRPREIFTRYPTPPAAAATFVGRVEGLKDPADAEVGIISLRGVQWTSNANYQWQPLNEDGTFTIAAAAFPEARRAIAVRSHDQSVTYLRAEFEPGDSAKDMVVRMKPTRLISIAANDSAGQPIKSFKVEIFDGSADGPNITDDEDRPLSTQRLDAPLASRGVLEVPLPLEPLCVMLSGNGIAPSFQKIDPRTSDHFAFSLLKATPISVTLTDHGKPVVDERVMLNNPAVQFSYTARKTDAAGKFTVPAGIPGTYRIAIRKRVVETTVIEGVPCEVNIDLADIPTVVPSTGPTTAPSL